MEYIKRAIEDVIEHSAQTFKCTLITGARQTGKSTLVKHLFADVKQVSFDDPFVEEQAKTNPEMFMSLNEPPVFFDKIQLNEYLYPCFLFQESHQKTPYNLYGKGRDSNSH